MIGRVETQTVRCGACEGSGKVQRHLYISNCCNCTIVSAMGDSWCSCCMDYLEGWDDVSD